MKTKSFAILMFGFAFSIQAMASDYLMFIGAGGEAKNKTNTIFDPTIQNIANYANGIPGLKVNVALNGGHSRTEALINKSFPNAETKTDFLESDYQRLIKSYVTKLESNEMVAGDQLMIYIDSHGAEKKGNLKSHVIATSQGSATNLNTLSGASTVDLDQLEKIKILAKAKGVKLAIIDASCHSGNTLALADNNTCVISSTGPNHYAYTKFSQNFSAAMSKGKNLEEIFLQTRKQDETAGLPMISTQSGQEVTDLLYENITPFLYHFGDKNDKLSPFMDKNQDYELQCLANFNSLMDTINQIEELNTVTKKVLWWKVKRKKVDLSNLKKLLSDYERSYVQIQKEMKALDTDRLNKKVTISNSSHTVSYTWKELLTTDFPALISGMQERMALETLPSNLILLKDLISIYSGADKKKENLLKSQPDLLNITEKEKTIKLSMESNYFTAAAIGKEERKLYSAMYQVNNKPNPCKDFIL